jgi:hypothetical protein
LNYNDNPSLDCNQRFDVQNYGTLQIVQQKGTISNQWGDEADMDILNNDLAKLRNDANLEQSIRDVDKIIEQLERAREQIVESKKASSGRVKPPTYTCPHRRRRRHAYNGLTDPNTAAITLTKLQNPLKNNFDKVNDDLRKVHRGHSTFGKSLDKVRNGFTSTRPKLICS